MSTTIRYRQAQERLAALRLLADDEPSLALRHSAQACSPYWQAAGLQVIPNESYEQLDASSARQIVIFTRHAASLGWLLHMLRGALVDYLTEENQSLIYGQFGIALRQAQAGPDGHSPVALQLAVLDAADLVLEAFAEAYRLRGRRPRRRLRGE